MALVNDPMAADPLAPKPKPLGTTAPATNPIPTTPAAVQPQAATPAPANDAKPSTPTAPTQLGAADPMAFAAKPATNPIPATPPATQPTTPAPFEGPAWGGPMPVRGPGDPGSNGMNQYGQYTTNGVVSDGNWLPWAQANMTRALTPEELARQQAGVELGKQIDAGRGPGYSTSPTDPNNDLRGKTIGPGAGLDRVGLAQQLMDNLRQQSEPQYQAQQRQLGQNAAANGQTGSGMFRTSLGDASRQHELDLQNGSLGFLSDALKGSVDDQHWNTNLAERQQAFQQNQQESAFGQQFAQQQLQEALTNGDFNRALQLLSAGNQGNPADTQLALSQLYGGQAGQAGQALSGAIQGRQANQPSAMDDFYKQYLDFLMGKGKQPGSTATPSDNGPVYGDG